MGLTCVIGPRGSGKTTLAEALRFVLNGVPDVKARSNLLRDNLSESTMVIRAQTENSEKLIVSRNFPGAPSITTPDSRTITGVELDRGSFLPFDAFSSKEIEDIADESLGTKRRGLLDSLRLEELREIEIALSQHRRDLDANGDALRASWRHIADLKEQIEELAGTPDKLAALPALRTTDRASKLTVSTKQQSLTLQDFEQLKSANIKVETIIAALRKEVESVAALKIEVQEESANRHVMTLANDALNASKEDGVALLDQAISRLRRFLDSLAASGRTLKSAQTEEIAEHQKLVEDNAHLGLAVQIRAKVEQDVMRLGAFKKQLGELDKKVEQIMSERRELRSKFLLERERISSVREEVAERLSEASRPSVKVAVIRNADNHVYEQTLLGGLLGSRLRNHEDVVAALARIRPDQLAQIMMDSDLPELELLAGLGQERSRKVLEALSENVRPLDLELIPTDDKIAIELNVGSDSAPNFRDAAELSRGQKCTALLPLLLGRRDVPLLIDQPEDNLDNHFIFETVVESIRRLKSRRQMIFITHNANIPVLAEAELVIVMNSDGKRGYVEKFGSLDECRDQIVDLLEGGEEAFEQRSIRYGKS